MKTMRRCRICNHYKVLSQFPPAKRSPGGLDTRCRDCKRIEQAKQVDLKRNGAKETATLFGRSVDDIQAKSAEAVRLWRDWELRDIPQTRQFTTLAQPLNRIG